MYCLRPCPFQRLGPSLQTKSIHNHVVTHAWWTAARARDLFWFVLLLLHASQLTRNRQFSTALHSNHSLNSSLQSLLASNPFSSTCLRALSGLPRAATTIWPYGFEGSLGKGTRPFGALGVWSACLILVSRNIE